MFPVANSALPYNGVGVRLEFRYSLVASCGVAGLFSARPRVCVEWAGDSLVPRCPVGLAGFVGPRTLRRRVVALGRGVAREHDGYMAGAFARVVELGRHTTLKMWRSGGRAGSSPATPKGPPVLGGGTSKERSSIRWSINKTAGGGFDSRTPHLGF